MIEQKEIKNLIESGFDLELISFEFDIPIQQLRQYKKELESSKYTANIETKTSDTIEDSDNKKNKNAHFKIAKMREKYRKLYFQNNSSEVERPKALSQEDIDLIESVISAIEEKIQKMQSLSRKEKRPIANEILLELKKIGQYQLPVEQARRLYTLMHSKTLQRLSVDLTDKIDFFINKQKGKIIAQLTRAIELEIYDATDVETLQKLDRKLTLDMARENPLSIGSVKSKILSKITAIKQQQAIARMRNDIPASIVSIITDLVSGNIDIEKANEIIDEESKKRVKSKPQTRFSLTEEQERRQILIQIRTAIAERADKYTIQSPEKVILQLQELCGGKLEESIRTVVKNLIAKKDFATAKSICDRFSEKKDYTKREYQESEYSKYIRGVRNDIRNAEISDIVLTAIKMNGTAEEETAYFELIEKGLKMGNVKLTAISLGKSKDGLRTITLADVWPDKISTDKLR